MGRDTIRDFMKHSISILIFALFLTRYAFALDLEQDAVFIRVIDVGPGLASVIRMPGDHYMVYDAGHWAGGGKRAFDGIKDVIPQGEDIDLLVLSHSDADHLAAADELLGAYTVKRVIRSGLERLQSNTWKNSRDAIRSASQSGSTQDINLKFVEFPPGGTYLFGDTFVTLVSGFYWPPSDWDLQNLSEKRNAGSIVIRLQFNGKSVLFTGDAVGRHIEDPDDALIATEKFMVEHSEVITIDSDVLIAPYHGADNASSVAFIKAVSPTWVIFSAGHAHMHPRATTANRYLNNGVQLENIFRTDFGDDEGAKEWNHGSIPGHSDKPGDDDVDIILRPTGEILVDYRTPH